VSTISLLGCSTSVALTMGPTDDKEEEIVTIICITSTNLVNDRKITNIHLSTPFIQNILEDSDDLWYHISTLEVVEFHTVHIRQSMKSSIF